MSLPVSILVNSVERSSVIAFDSVRRQDNLNSLNDTFDFSVTYHEGQTWRPTVNAEVEFFVNSVKEFGGIIIEVNETLDGHSALVYDVVCKDYSHNLDRILVTERFENSNVQAAIIELLIKYAPTFTYADVEGSSLLFEAVTFDRQPLTNVLSELASQNNYSWYVDYNRGVHFFNVNDEVAPFDLTDTSANYVFDSLEFKTDFSQLRNRILFKGGEVETNTRTETHSGTATKEEFALAYKYASLPTVTVGGVGQTVGIDNLDDPGAFDCLWSFQQKYIKFTAGNIPASAANNILVTGIPLLPLNVRVSDSASIAAYGTYEYLKEETRISTKEDALAFAQAELQAYKDPLREGSFETNTAGLRSGQTINVTSVLRDINEDFIIQSVEIMLQSQNSALYRVELATLKMLTLTTLLQSLFKKKSVDIDSLESLFSFIQFIDPFKVTDSYTSPFTKTTGPYRYEVTAGVKGRWNKSTWT